MKSILLAYTVIFSAFLWAVEPAPEKVKVAQRTLLNKDFPQCRKDLASLMGMASNTNTLKDAASRLSSYNKSKGCNDFQQHFHGCNEIGSDCRKHIDDPILGVTWPSSVEDHRVVLDRIFEEIKWLINYMESSARLMRRPGEMEKARKPVSKHMKKIQDGLGLDDSVVQGFERLFKEGLSMQADVKRLEETQTAQSKTLEGYQAQDYASSVQRFEGGGVREDGPYFSGLPSSERSTVRNLRRGSLFGPTTVREGSVESIKAMGVLGVTGAAAEGFVFMGLTGVSAVGAAIGAGVGAGLVVLSPFYLYYRRRVRLQNEAAERSLAQANEKAEMDQWRRQKGIGTRSLTIEEESQFKVDSLNARISRLQTQIQNTEVGSMERAKLGRELAKLQSEAGDLTGSSGF